MGIRDHLNKCIYTRTKRNFLKNLENLGKNSPYIRILFTPAGAKNLVSFLYCSVVHCLLYGIIVLVRDKDDEQNKPNKIQSKNTLLLYSVAQLPAIATDFCV